MRVQKQKREIKSKECSEEMSLISKILTVFLFLIFSSAFYLVFSFKPLTKEEQMENFNKMNDQVEPFRRNLSECARQVRASGADVENFMKRVPQTSMEGKCFVACILKRNGIIRHNKIMLDTVFELNKAVYEEDSDVMARLKVSGEECLKVVEDIFEVCEYASLFNDCMHMKMEHMLDKLTMERRMEALGQMTSNADEWGEDEDELLKLAKDEL